MSPATLEGEARGSRNEFIHWLQDVFDQRGLVRGYMRYDNEIRVGANVKQIVHRAMQFATSDPMGPVYLAAAREVMEQEIPARHRSTTRAGRRLRPWRCRPARRQSIVQSARECEAAARRHVVSRAQSGGERAARAVRAAAGHRCARSRRRIT